MRLRNDLTVKAKAYTNLRTSLSANVLLPLSLRTELMEWDGMKDSCRQRADMTMGTKRQAGGSGMDGV